MDNGKTKITHHGPNSVNLQTGEARHFTEEEGEEADIVENNTKHVQRRQGGDVVTALESEYPEVAGSNPCAIAVCVSDRVTADNKTKESHRHDGQNVLKLNGSQKEDLEFTPTRL